MSDYTVDHPVTINIEVTERCNLRCKMCGRAKDPPGMYGHTDMSMDVFHKITPLMEKASAIWLSGFGEPLMNKNLPEMVRVAKERSRNAEVSFTTNATLLTARMAEALVEAGLDKMQVSIDGDCALGHVSGGGSIARVVSNIRRLNDVKAAKNKDRPEVTFAFTVMKDNLKELVPVLHIAHDLGVKFMTVQPLRPFSEEMRDQNVYRHLDIARKYVDKGVEKAKEYGITLQAHFMDIKLTGERRVCNFPNNFIHVSYDGSVYMCCGGISSGFNVRSLPITEIWNSEPYRTLRERLERQDFPDACRVCALMFNTIENQESSIPPPETAKKKVIRLLKKIKYSKVGTRVNKIKTYIGR